MYKWLPLLDRDYSEVFDLNCNPYPGYLDNIMHGLDILNMPDHDTCGEYFTVIENDIYTPT